MKRRQFALTSLLVASSLLAGSHAQASLKDDMKNYLFKRKAFAVVEDYTENTARKTLTALIGNIHELQIAAGQFRAEPNQNNLDRTIAAWQNSWMVFNRAQVLMFGPAAYYDFHKRLAIWPVDKVLVDHALTEIKEGKLTLNANSLKEKTASMRGLHAAKYLLFANGEPKALATISDNERDYLAAVTEVMLWEGLDFKAAWFGTAGLTVDEQTLLSSAGFRQRLPYAEELKTPGSPDSRYFSISMSLQELIMESFTVIEDMLPDIKNLLADSGDNTFHYWESLDPYGDIIHRLEGVENCYLGGVPGSREASFSELVAKKDHDLDERIKAAFASVIQRLTAARELKNGDREQYELAVRVVLSESEKLVSRLTAATPLVTADPAVEPFAPYGSNM